MARCWVCDACHEHFDHEGALTDCDGCDQEVCASCTVPAGHDVFCPDCAPSSSNEPAETDDDRDTEATEEDTLS